MWLVEKKQIAEEPTFHELIDDKQGYQTSVTSKHNFIEKKSS